MQPSFGVNGWQWASTTQWLGRPEAGKPPGQEDETGALRRPFRAGRICNTEEISAEEMAASSLRGPVPAGPRDRQEPT
jgi:hypothetical protein